MKCGKLLGQLPKPALFLKLIVYHIPFNTELPSLLPKVNRGSSWPRDQTCVSCIGGWIPSPLSMKKSCIRMAVCVCDCQPGSPGTMLNLWKIVGKFLSVCLELLFWELVYFPLDSQRVIWPPPPKKKGSKPLHSKLSRCHRYLDLGCLFFGLFVGNSFQHLKLMGFPIK